MRNYERNNKSIICLPWQDTNKTPQTLCLCRLRGFRNTVLPRIYQERELT